MRKSRVAIYRSRRHVAITLLLVAVPFVFFLVFTRLTELATGRLFADIGVSALRLVIAFLIAAVLGWLFAVSFYRGRRATIALPLFDALQSFPTFAALPLAIALWGPSNITVVVVLVLTIIWPLFFSVIGSLKLIKRDWEEAAAMAGIRGVKHLTQFLLPASTPGLITGSVIGLGEAWEAVVATEIIVGTPTGLGEFFQASSHNPTITAFGIFGLLLIIFIVNKIIWLPLLEWSHHTLEE